MDCHIINFGVEFSCDDYRQTRLLNVNCTRKYKVQFSLPITS